MSSKHGPAPARPKPEPEPFARHESAGFGGTKLFRKSACACGGSCPSCQGNSQGIKVSHPSDSAEIEADRVADTVMRMPAVNVGSKILHPADSNHVKMIHRKCSACDEEDEAPAIQRKAVVDTPVSSSSYSESHVRDAIGSGGTPLDRQTRAFFEPRFGYDLANVRVHTGSRAESSADAVDARAYTLGSNIVFGRGEYLPGTEAGRHLLAHELAHIVQHGIKPLSADPTLHRQPHGKNPKIADIPLKDAELVMKSIMEILNGVDRSDPAKWKGHPIFKKYRAVFILWYELTNNKEKGSGAKLEGEAFLNRFEEAKAKTQPILNVVLTQGGGTSKSLLVDKYQPKVIEFEKRADSEKRILELRKNDSASGSKKKPEPPKDTPMVSDKPSVASQAYGELEATEKPEQPLETTCSTTQPDPDFFHGSVMNDPLYFAPVNQFDEGCTSCHPNVNKPQAGPVAKPKKKISEPELLTWAADYVWIKATDKSKRKKPLFRLLQYREDKLLDTAWDSYRKVLNSIITSLHVDDINQIFVEGNRSAKCRAATYLDTNWPTVKVDLKNRAETLFVEEIRTILNTRVIIPGSSLITDPVKIRKIVENPKVDEVPLGRWGATAKTGFEWGQKHLVSVVYPILFYEVAKHEGIFFEVDVYDFMKTDPFIEKVASDVVKNTEGMVIVGKFIKGFLNTVASPVVIVLDTAAKVLDMATMGVSYVNQKLGWHDFGFTCLSSTCRSYEACIQNNSSKKCADDALQAAVEEATIIAPIVRQAGECFSDGDPEACGGIAAAALGLIKMPEGKGAKLKGASPKGSALGKVAYEEALIRDAVKRPREGDPSFGKAFEEPTGRAKGKAPKAGDIVTAAEEIRKTAEANNIPPKKLAAEVEEIRSKTADPENVKRPSDEAMDAEIDAGKASGEEHNFQRDKAKRTWCRRTKPVCGLDLGDKVNIDTDVAISKKNLKEFKNAEDLQTKGWLGKDLKVGDPLPDGYAWNNGKVFRKPGMVNAGFAPLTILEGKLTIKEAAGRISNPSNMNRNFKVAVTETLKAENPKWTDAKVKTEAAKIIDKSAVHHLIPDNVVQDHPVGAAAREAGYDLDRGSNLKGLPKSKELTNVRKGDTGHWSSHAQYDQLVRGELDKVQAGLEKEFGSLSKVPKDRLLNEMKKIEDKFREKIDKGEVPKKDGRLAELIVEEEMDLAYA